MSRYILAQTRQSTLHCIWCLTDLQSDKKNDVIYESNNNKLQILNELQTVEIETFRTKTRLISSRITPSKILLKLRIKKKKLLLKPIVKPCVNYYNQSKTICNSLSFSKRLFQKVMTKKPEIGKVAATYDCDHRSERWSATEGLLNLLRRRTLGCNEDLAERRRTGSKRRRSAAMVKRRWGERNDRSILSAP